MQTKPILAFDCSCLGASISLRARGTTHTKTLAQSRQAAELIPAIDQLLRDTHVSYRELGAIITTTGPGSFTGLRIGLAALHGLVLVHRTPIHLLTTHQAMGWSVANQADAPSDFLMILRVGKGEVAAQRFTYASGQLNAIGEPFLSPETRDQWPQPDYGNHLTPGAPHYLAGPDTALLCALAHHFPESPLADAVPFYIRPPDAKLPGGVLLHH